MGAGAIVVLVILLLLSLTVNYVLVKGLRGHRGERDR
jgi:hypothetical protein